MKDKSHRLCLVSVLFHDAFVTPLTHMKNIMREISPESSSIIAVSPEHSSKLDFNDKFDHLLVYKSKNNPLARLINYALLNVRFSYQVMKKSKDTDSFLLFMETGMLLPMCFMKFYKKQIIWVLPSSLGKRVEHHHDVLSKILIPLQFGSHIIADKIILYSPNLTKEWKLEKFSQKIFYAHEHYLDFDTFNILKPYNERSNRIGYIGRLEKEKGICSFVESLPGLLENNQNFQVTIIGDGKLRKVIEEFIIKNGLNSRVELLGWIQHEDLPIYLNNMKVLVIPSYTEGLPNIMLEAMACGTIVLASSVGAIPTIIKNQISGFILKNNSAECIVNAIMIIMDYKDSEFVIRNANRIVQNEFRLEKNTEKFMAILDDTS